MKIGIRSFTLSLLLVLISGMYIIFANYYFTQREITAKLITNSITNDLSELSYVLSKHIQKNSIKTARALIDRKAANNNYLSAISIFDDDKLILTTDPRFSQFVSSSVLYNNPHQNIYENLHDRKAFQDNINYYERKSRRSYSLIFFIDHNTINKNFTQARERFILLFIFIPIIFLTVFWLAIHKLIASPLEDLRQYAYYQSKIPLPFSIKELEHIRISMVQTFSRLEQEKTDLYNLSRTDALSGLANRNYLEERVIQIIAESERRNKEFALLFLDLDHFKSINDSLGHDIGDELLRSVAHTIQDVLRVNDVVARIGGDEFVIVLTHYQDELELIEIISRIQEKLMKPWQIKTYPIHITSSIGITIYPKDGTNLLSLMKNADIAMYEAKSKGRRGYHFFTKELNDKTQEYIELTNTMQEALTKDQYELFYQPQNNVTTGEIIGAEALIRWKHPDKGMISPYAFIPIAEHNGFIIELGKWILETGIKQKKSWEDEGINIKLSINVAAKQIQQADFVEHLKSLLDKYQVNTSNVFLEITEYIFLHDSKAILKTFTAIRELGIKISLDDFGTGYSSLSYLKNFPIDILKIDKVFLDDYNSTEGAVFIETIVKMAQTLKMRVVAEGVETQEQIEYLQSLKCDFYQGYVCSRPLEIEAFNALYKEKTFNL